MKKFLAGLTKVEAIVAGILIGLLSFFVIGDVIAREVFTHGFPWAQKLAVVMMIWAGFLGAALVAQKAGHLRPEIADKLWGEKNILLFVRVQNLAILLFSIFFLKASGSYVLESMDFGDESVTLHVKLWVLQLVIPYTFFSIGLRNVYFIIHPKEQLEYKREFS